MGCGGAKSYDGEKAGSTIKFNTLCGMYIFILGLELSHEITLNPCTIKCIGSSAAQMVARGLAVRQARVRISARHPMEVPPTEPAAIKIWRRASPNVMSG